MKKIARRNWKNSKSMCDNMAVMANLNPSVESDIHKATKILEMILMKLDKIETAIKELEEKNQKQ